jgi:hypothetical protein
MPHRPCDLVTRFVLKSSAKSKQKHAENKKSVKPSCVKKKFREIKKTMDLRQGKEIGTIEMWCSAFRQIQVEFVLFFSD